MSRIRSECPDLESSESSFDKSPTRKRTKRKTRTRATATAKKKMTVMATQTTTATRCEPVGEG